MINPMDLTGKHILITGGSSGIGRACAIQASRLGARVTLIARREDKLQETIRLMDRPEQHAYYVFDLLETDRIEGLVNTIVSERGSVDGLCHAAGLGTMRTIKLNKPAFVEKMARIHEFAFIELVRALRLHKNLADGASLVGVSSIAAAHPGPGQSAYAAAKGGMNAFVRAAAIEFASRNIRINTVAYAMVGTEMFQEFLDNGGDVSLMKRQYLGLIDAESAANAILFLLSDACRYITASVLPVFAGGGNRF